MEEGKEWSLNKQNETTTRPSLKSDAPFNKYQLWKHKLRNNCYKRVREDRTRLLWKFRCSQQEEDIVKCAFQDIVSDEFNKMKHTDEMLWEYEGPPDTTYQDLECDIETWEDEVDQYLARAVCEHMQLNEDEAHGKEIWCPICKQGELKDNHNIICCTCCELRLHKASKLTLDFLLDRLAKVHTEHFDKGCRLKPKFCMRTKFNLTALYISCEGCDTFEVVI
ncbi:RPA-interacting protein A [Glycine soja]